MKILCLYKHNYINYEHQFKFKECRSINPLPFDFYLPKHSLCIEYDGEQHFKPIDIFGGQKAFEELKMRNNIKTKYCEDNDIKLLRIKYSDNIKIKLKENLT